MSNIQGLKMVTGEEIVAEVIFVTTVDGKTVSYKIKHPLVLRIQPVAPGKAGLTFVPWMLAAPEGETVEIPADHIVAVTAVAPHIKDEFVKQTSPIEMPAKPKLII